MSNDFKDRTIRIEDVPSESKRLLEQVNKPYFALSLVMAIGVIMAVYTNLRYVGIAIVIVISYVLLFTKERKLFTITEDYIIVYIYKNDRECNIYYLEDILSWEFSPGKNTLDVINLRLTDGSTYKFETISPNRLLKTMRTILPNQEIKPAKKR